jgi:gamma-glutamyltranspeptidase/glutathione hydrolase
MSSRFIEQARLQLGRSAEAQRLYLGNGGPRPGKVATQGAGRDLPAGRRGGAGSFLPGADRQVDRSRGHRGGRLAHRGRPRRFQGRGREPLRITHAARSSSRCRRHSPPSRCSETFNILEGYDIAGWGHNSADYFHHLIEAIKLGSADLLAYAYSGDIPIKGLLSKAYAASQRARINAGRAAVSEGERHNCEKLAGQIAEGHPAKFADEQTTHFACADADGTVVSVTQTLGVPFGSGFAVPGTGLVLNNILKWSDLDPASPNVVRAGRKAGTMMSPTHVFKDGAFALSVGTPGSYGILQTQPQMLLNLLEFGFSMQEAIEQPRVRVYRDRLVDAESRIPEATREDLARRGHEINVIDDWSWVVGGGQGIARDPESGAWMAGADPRRDCYALAI